jgi:hypothetical protein
LSSTGSTTSAAFTKKAPDLLDDRLDTDARRIHLPSEHTRVAFKPFGTAERVVPPLLAALSNVHGQ